MRWALGLLVAGFVLGGASPALATGVSTPNVTTPTTNAAGGRTKVVATFTTSPVGGLSGSDSITVAFPGGTGFAGYFDSSIVVGGVEVGACGGANGTTLTCTLGFGQSIGGSTPVALTVNGVTNPAAGPQQLTVSTTRDTDLVLSNPFQIVAAQPLSQQTATISSPSAAAGARTKYVIGFTTSSTGALANDANSAVVLTFPNGTGFSPGYFDSSIVVGGVEVGACGGAIGTTLRCTLGFGRTIAPGTAVTVTVNGLTNVTAQGAQHVDVSTTSDPAAQPAAYTVVAANSISTPAVTISSPSAAAGARTKYVIGFTTSSTGALSNDANSSIVLTFPVGTGFSPGYFDSGVVVAGVEIGSCGGATGTTLTCTLGFGRTIAASTPVTVTVNGLTNVAQGAQHVDVSTTSDPAPQPGAYTVVAANSISSPTVTIADPSAAAGARTKYVIGFTTSSTGALANDANSSIVLTFPAGTGFSPGYFDSAIVVAGVEVGACGGATGTTLTCTLGFGRTIAASTPVTVTVNGLTNVATQGAQHVDVSTTSDPAPQPGAYTVVAAHTIANLAVHVGTAAPSTPTPYTITFGASSTGALSNDANSAIRLTFPAGTTFGSYNSSSIVVGGTSVGACGGASGTTLTCTLGFGRTIAAGASVAVTVTNVTNPASGAPWTLTASTTSDPQTVPSSPYSEGGAPVATIDSGPSAPTSAPSFTFSGGSAFECRVDAAPFASCTSPYAPTGLAPGPHTFEVRAVGGAAASRAFTVAAPQQATPTPAPTATATPTPTPTPVPGKSVVGQPVSGKVLVKKPGSNQFVEVDASQGIPLGSTVDAKAGAIALTAKAGQTATFSEGIFKVTQSHGITDLTLTEPLAPCKKAAAAAKKKPKTRKLWGDGSGSFRTRGQYSAATIRGTRWLVQDSCAGTLTKVTKGVVSVRDDVKRKTILVKAGKQYLAKPRRSA